MKCPLIQNSYQAGEVITESEPVNCLEEECAWWDDGNSACAIWSLMSGLDALGKLFREIEQKMPHKGQFRK